MKHLLTQGRTLFEVQNQLKSTLVTLHLNVFTFIYDMYTPRQRVADEPKHALGAIASNRTVQWSRNAAMTLPGSKWTSRTFEQQQDMNKQGTCNEMRRRLDDRTAPLGRPVQRLRSKHVRKSCTLHSPAQGRRRAYHERIDDVDEDIARPPRPTTG